MKRIVSFSLWGDNPKYTIGALYNAELVSEIYPDWTARFYVGKSTPVNVGKKLEKLGSEVVYMDDHGNWTGMFWRFYPAGESDVEIMISRDTDSRLSFREKTAVDDWLASDKDFHIMRDHPAHNAPIMGGMWGARGHILKDIKNMIEEYQKGDFWQVDQIFLREKIYPMVKSISYVNDEFFEKKPFPTNRKNYEFVGDVFDENNIRHPEHWKVFLK
jgi:hypothetical protein